MTLTIISSGKARSSLAPQTNANIRTGNAIHHREHESKVGAHLETARRVASSYPSDRRVGQLIVDRAEIDRQPAVRLDVIIDEAGQIGKLDDFRPGLAGLDLRVHMRDEAREEIAKDK